jgi:hypothetical protein
MAYNLPPVTDLNEEQLRQAELARMESAGQSTPQEELAPLPPPVQGPEYVPEAMPGPEQGPAAPEVTNEIAPSAVEANAVEQALAGAPKPEAAVIPPKPSRKEQLYQALQARGGADIAGPPAGNAHMDRASQALYAAVSRTKLPDSFFQRPESAPDYELNRQLKMAQVAKLLSDDKQAGKMAANVEEVEKAGHAQIDQMLADGLITPSSAASLHMRMKAAPIDTSKQIFDKAGAPERKAEAAKLQQTESDRRFSNNEFNQRMDVAKFDLQKQGIDTSTAKTVTDEASKYYSDVGGAPGAMFRASVQGFKKATGDSFDKIEALTGSSDATGNYQLTPETMQSLGSKHMVNLWSKRLFGAVGDAWERLTNEGKSPTEANDILKKEDVQYRSADMMYQQAMYLYKTMLSGKQITGSEQKYMDRILADQAGASPVDRLLAIKFASDAYEKMLSARWSTLGAMSAVPGVKLFIDTLKMDPNFPIPDASKQPGLPVFEMSPTAHIQTPTPTIGKKAPEVAVEPASAPEPEVKEPPADFPLAKKLQVLRAPAAQPASAGLVKMRRRDGVVFLVHPTRVEKLKADGGVVVK